MEPNYAICIEVFPERCTSRPQLQIIVHSHARELSVIQDSNENSIKVQSDPVTPGIRNEEGMKHHAPKLKAPTGTGSYKQISDDLVQFSSFTINKCNYFNNGDC